MSGAARARKRPAGPPADRDKAVRDHVLDLLRGGGAHVPFEKAVADLPARLRGAKPEGLPFSPWRLLEHMRLAQWDILEFSRDPKHVSPDWPSGYWPEADAPPGAAAWDKSIKAFRSDLAAMQDLVADKSNDLLAPFAHGDGQTLLREALLVADHNAYHVGELVAVRRMLGAWSSE
jgi:hypothetical protein